MNLKTLLKQAASPRQYENFSDWNNKDVNNTIKNFWQTLKKYKFLFKNKKVLDIGAGNGWLLNTLRKNGAKECFGVEPSQKSYNLALKLHPKLKLTNQTLQKFKTKRKFDSVFLIMSASHFGKLNWMFKKVHTLLNPHGYLTLIIPGFNFFKEQRPEAKVHITKINDDEYLAETNYMLGKIVDIVRKPEVYLKSANGYKLTIVTNILLSKSQSNQSEWKKFKNIPVAHLLIFKK